MTFLDFLNYIWAPVVYWLWTEIRDLRDKVSKTVSREEASKMISDYLDPRIEPLKAQLDKIDTKLDEVVMLLASWRNQNK